MKNFLFYSANNADLAFCMAFEEKDAEQASALAREGFYAWNTCGRYPEEYEHFTEKDADWIENAGYMEPSIELLDNAGIAYRELDWLDEEGELLPEYENEELEQVSC